MFDKLPRPELGRGSTARSFIAGYLGFQAIMGIGTAMIAGPALLEEAQDNSRGDPITYCDGSRPLKPGQVPPSKVPGLVEGASRKNSINNGRMAYLFPLVGAPVLVPKLSGETGTNDVVCVDPTSNEIREFKATRYAGGSEENTVPEISVNMPDLNDPSQTTVTLKN